MDDDDDEFCDTISVNSNTFGSKRRLNNKDYMSLSRNTIYLSAVDLDGVEMVNMESGGSNQQKKVSRNSKAVTYSQWRDRRWRTFNNSDLIVDFVLAYNENSNKENIRKREIFENNLAHEGLLLQKEENQRIHFLQIHVPREVLCRYAEILKLRLPIKADVDIEFKKSIFSATVNKILDCLGVRLDHSKFPPQKYQLTAEFRQDKNYLFAVESENFFNTSVRIAVVSYILDRTKFTDRVQDKGIKRLISEGVYKAAYPLHDGDLGHKGSKRKLLLDEWASVSKCIKYQPLDELKDYFGVKFALYFAWLGFYTHMLIPASVVGLLCLVYAWSTASSDYLSHDICNLNITMCPRCDKYCDYWNLNESCTYSKIAHYIDNPATIFFALFMSFWAALYLELWKRYSAEITHRWGLTGFDLQSEPPRPEYLSKLANAKVKENIVTQSPEPFVPFWRVKLPSLILSFTIALLWVLVALAVVSGIVLYRMSLFTSDTLYKDKSSYSIYVVPITAGVLNLVGILILNYIYGYLAEWLTEMELQRTQTEFDESLTVKIYMFQFVNYYSSIFYIAFLKGKFVGYPAKYNRIFGYRQEECSPGGCLMELTIQLAVIMIGNQAINAIFEMITPLLTKMYNTFVITTGLAKNSESNEEIIISCNQWTEDYKLTEMGVRSLFYEYLEMVLQYGFVTIFVTAFPLAPLFALINNIFEMRLDAKKFIKYYRRPVPERVTSIGVWYTIMAFLGRISVVSNAFIIAFSSHFIPKLVYALNVNPYHTEEGFLEYSLAYFNTSDFQVGAAPENSLYNVSICRYAEFRNPPHHEHKYKRPLDYWQILAARLVFIVVYQNIVSFIITIVQWSIPDIPRRLNNQIKREAYRTNEIIIKYETERAREKLTRSKNRDSVISSETVYADANGDVIVDANEIGGLTNRRRNNSIIYHDTAEL